MKKKSILNNQKGAVAVIFVILVGLVLIGLTALGIDAGRWYAAREKAQEACDAAVLGGVQAYGLTNWKSLAEDMARENFPQGYLGFQLCSNDFVGSTDSGGPRVDGTISVTAETFFGGVIGIDTVNVCVSCAAGRIPLEIMLVLDRSDSLTNELEHLKDAAQSFVDNFVETEEVDRMGLIIFSTGVQVPFRLRNYFIRDGIKTEIGNITLGTNGNVDTNMEDALDQADDDKERNGDATTTLTKYPESTPQSQRARQFLIFFTDGTACGFRAPFTRNGITYDGVVPYHTFGEYGTPVDVCPGLDKNEVTNKGWLHDPYTGESTVNNYIDPDGVKVFVPYSGNNGKVCFGPTGDGLPTDGLPEDELTRCKWDCSATNEPNNPAYWVTGEPEYELPYENTRWHVFGTDECPVSIYNSEYGECEDDYSIDDYCLSWWCLGGLPLTPNCCDSPYCNINTHLLKTFYLNAHDPNAVPRKMTIYHARKLKEQGIIIYCIGLGNVDRTFLEGIATAPENYRGSDADGLTSIFNEIALEAKKQVHLLQPQ